MLDKPELRWMLMNRALKLYKHYSLFTEPIMPLGGDGKLTCCNVNSLLRFDGREAN